MKNILAQAATPERCTKGYTNVSNRSAKAMYEKRTQQRQTKNNALADGEKDVRSATADVMAEQYESKIKRKPNKSLRLRYVHEVSVKVEAKPRIMEFLISLI